MLDASQILILLVVTLGPLKILGPFVQQTRDLDGPALRRLTLRVFILSVVSILVAAFLGSALLVKWGISLPALMIAIGVIFFLVAIQMVLAQYGSDRADVPPLPQDSWAAALRLTFPTVLTPYGIAAVIALLAATDDPSRVRMIVALALVVMALNYVFMLFARKIMRGVALLVLQILGSVLGVLQVALSVQILLWALAELGVLAV
ncbi:MAG TPA: MarC family protein [Candidatus Eisenbacteria bacterium]|nr:MarC family protein [Candidatus Eisenbacteria bacterium]